MVDRHEYMECPICGECKHCECNCEYHGAKMNPLLETPDQINFDHHYYTTCGNANVLYVKYGGEHHLVKEVVKYIRDNELDGHTAYVVIKCECYRHNHEHNRGRNLYTIPINRFRIIKCDTHCPCGIEKEQTNGR